jgi:hypothetical protein
MLFTDIALGLLLIYRSPFKFLDVENNNERVLLISWLMYLFNSEKTPILRGCESQDECEGIQRSMISESMQ